MRLIDLLIEGENSEQPKKSPKIIKNGIYKGILKIYKGNTELKKKKIEFTINNVTFENVTFGKNKKMRVKTISSDPNHEKQIDDEIKKLEKEHGKVYIKRLHYGYNDRGIVDNEFGDEKTSLAYDSSGELVFKGVTILEI